jgi:hypothetical protein
MSRFAVAIANLFTQEVKIKFVDMASSPEEAAKALDSEIPENLTTMEDIQGWYLDSDQAIAVEEVP